jgi:flagellar basal-body rod modification protein FlgD
MNATSAATALRNQKTIEQIIEEGVSSTSQKRNTGELGKNEFLQLLITQLQYQDPLNPTNDQEFIAQMAQFSALEQMQNLNQSFESNRAYSLIGKSVTAVKTDSKTGKSEEIIGDVTSVKVSAGKVLLVVDGEDISLDEVVEVSEGSTVVQSNLAGFTALINCLVKGIAYDASNGSMIMVSGTVKAIQKGYYEDYAILDGVEAEIAGIYKGTSSSADYILEKIKSAYESGETIDVVITDEKGTKVPVTATIASYSQEGNKIKAILNGVSVPLEGINKITKQVVEAGNDAAAAGTEEIETESDVSDDEQQEL